MNDVIKYGTALWNILKDGKITENEKAAFLEALAGFIVAVVTILLPFIRGNAAIFAKRLAAGIQFVARS